MQLTVIQNKIYEIREQKVILDFDLSKMYEIETKVLKQAVKRNINCFPNDFMFEITRDEYKSLRSQIVALEKGHGREKYSKYLPAAFMEQGVAMLSSVLNSEKAIEVNIIIIRTFVLIREFALNYKDLQRKISKLEKKYNNNFKEIFQALNLLLANNKRIFKKKQELVLKKINQLTRNKVIF